MYSTWKGMSRTIIARSPAFWGKLTLDYVIAWVGVQLVTWDHYEYY